MPAVAIVFGWPAIAVSIVLAALGIVAGRARLVLAGAVVACPFLVYLFLTPRLRWFAAPAALLFFLASGAVEQRRRRMALLLIAPYVALVGFVLYLVASLRG
jgi:hypothetical protein